MAEGEIHVSRGSTGWRVSIEGSRRAQSSRLSGAGRLGSRDKEIARRKQTKAILHGRDGRVHEVYAGGPRRGYVSVLGRGSSVDGRVRLVGGFPWMGRRLARWSRCCWRRLFLEPVGSSSEAGFSCEHMGITSHCSTTKGRPTMSTTVNERDERLRDERVGRTPASASRRGGRDEAVV